MPLTIVLLRLIFLFLLAFLPFFSFAQEENLEFLNEGEGMEEKIEAVEVSALQIKAEAGSDQIAEVGKKITFDGSFSEIRPEDAKVEYRWNFGDGSLARGSNVVHSYEASGEYRVVLTITSLDNPEIKDEDSLNVYIYEDLVILITDKDEEEDEELRRLLNRARRDGVLMTIFKPDKEEKNDFLRSEKLVRNLLEGRETFKKTHLIIGWTEGDESLNALIKLSQNLSNLEDLGFKDKNIIIIREDKFNLISNLAQAVFDNLSPMNVILTQDTALNPLLNVRKPDKIISAVQASGAEYKIFGIYSQRVSRELKITNLFSYVVNFMINKGVPIETILLVLMLPVVATLIALIRQIIGLQTFGIYTPTIVALSFVATGLKYGLAIFLLILLTGTLGRLILKKTRILHIPKLAIVLTFVSIAILGMLAEGAASSRTGLISVSLFPMLILMTLAERFVNVQVEKGAKIAIRISLETLLISILCYYIVNWQTLRNTLLAYPEIILGTLIINFTLGKWTGLTLREYFRFREVIKALRRRG